MGGVFVCRTEWCWWCLLEIFKDKCMSCCHIMYEQANLNILEGKAREGDTLRNL